jgi:small subunit ribosomal protein S9
MADEPTNNADEQPNEPTVQAEQTPAVEAPAEIAFTESVEEPTAQPAEVTEPNAETAGVDTGSTEEQAPADEEPVAVQDAVEESVATIEPTAEAPVAEEPSTGAPSTEEPTVEAPAVEEPSAKEPSAKEPAVQEPVSDDADEEDEEPTPRVKPTVPGAHLEVDIVPEGVDPLAPEQPADPYAVEEYDEPQAEEEPESGRLSEPISTAAIDLAAGARYNATGKRKTAIARVILRPGSGAYLVNGRALDEHFPRITLQRNIRQPLETVGYQDRMDVVALLQGGGISAQAGALRHGISRALLEADPNLRGELKRRGFLTRDSRAKERKKAGLKKARKRPQFSKR